MKSGLLATKSVSQLSSSSALPECATSPLAAVRPARLPTSLAPLMRRNSTALSKSPSASSRAFLQSIIPEPVSSRSRLTSGAVKLDMILSRLRTRSGLCGRRGGVFGLGTLEELALPLGEWLVTGHDARLGLGVRAGGTAGAGDKAI